jgi:hypothetical protein
MFISISDGNILLRRFDIEVGNQNDKYHEGRRSKNIYANIDTDLLKKNAPFACWTLQAYWSFCQYFKG